MYRGYNVPNPLATMADGIVQRQQNDKDIQNLEKLSARVDRDRQMDAQAAQQEAAYYEQIRKEAKDLLPADRKKIAEKSKQIRFKSRELLEIYGGDKSKFMNNGGRSMLNNYTNDLLSSDEMINYEENSKNLERILDAQKRGMGHLVSKSDLRNMKNYDPEKGGTITYKGLMNEVEVDSLRSNYSYNQQIPYSAILNHEGNRAKIEANYMINYPDKGRPNEQEIRTFMYEMGYGGLGSDRTLQKEQLQRDREALRARAKTEKETGTKGKRLFTTDYTQYTNSFKRAIPTGLNASSWREEYNSDASGYVMEKTGAGKGIIKDGWDIRGSKYDYDKPGIDIENPFAFLGNDYQLTEGKSMFKGGESKITQALFGEDYKVENGYIKNFSINNKGFDSTGNQLNPEAEETVEGGKYHGNYKIEGISQAFFVKDNNGNKKIVTNMVNDKGEIQEEDDKKWKEEQYKNNEWQSGSVVALRDNDGRLYYYPLNLHDNLPVQNQINSLYEGNDFTQVAEANQASEERRYEVQTKNNKEAAQLQQNVSIVSNAVESHGRFASINRDYSQPGTEGNINRSDLIKSAHVALYQQYLEDNPNTELKLEQFVSSALDKDVFTNGLLIEEDIIDMVGNKSYEKNMTDDQVIQEWFKMTTRGMDPDSEEYTDAKKMHDKWLQFLEY